MANRDIDKLLLVTFLVLGIAFIRMAHRQGFTLPSRAAGGVRRPWLRTSAGR